MSAAINFIYIHFMQSLPVKRERNDYFNIKIDFIDIIKQFGHKIICSSHTGYTSDFDVLSLNGQLCFLFSVHFILFFFSA